MTSIALQAYTESFIALMSSINIVVDKERYRSTPKETYGSKTLFGFFLSKLFGFVCYFYLFTYENIIVLYGFNFPTMICSFKMETLS